MLDGSGARSTRSVWPNMSRITTRYSQSDGWLCRHSEGNGTRKVKRRAVGELRSTEPKERARARNSRTTNHSRVRGSRLEGEEMDVLCTLSGLLKVTKAATGTFHLSLADLARAMRLWGERASKRSQFSGK